MLPADTRTLLTLERYREAVLVIGQVLQAVDRHDAATQRRALEYIAEVVQGVLGPQRITAANEREN